MLAQTSASFRFLAFVTLITFFPSSIAIWHIVPERWVVVYGEEPEPVAHAAAINNVNPSVKAVQPVPEDQLKTILGGPGAFKDIVGSKGDLPKAETLLASIPKPRPKSASVKPDPTKIAQLNFGREQRGPLGPQEAADALDAADALKGDLQISDALIAYFDIMDAYPAEALWADQGRWDLIHGPVSGYRRD